MCVVCVCVCARVPVIDRLVVDVEVRQPVVGFTVPDFYLSDVDVEAPKVVDGYEDEGHQLEQIVDCLVLILQIRFVDELVGEFKEVVRLGQYRRHQQIVGYADRAGQEYVEEQVPQELRVDIV